MIPTIKSLTHNAATQTFEVVCSKGVLIIVTIQIAFPMIANKVGRTFMQNSIIIWVVKFVFIMFSLVLQWRIFGYALMIWTTNAWVEDFNLIAWFISDCVFVAHYWFTWLVQNKNVYQTLIQFSSFDWAETSLINASLSAWFMAVISLMTFDVGTYDPWLVSCHFRWLCLALSNLVHLFIVVQNLVY